MQDPADLVLEQNHNPLKRQVPVVDPTQEFTDEWLEEFKAPLDLEKARLEPHLRDRVNSGWLSWRKTYNAYLAPDPEKYPFPHADQASEEAVGVIREIAQKESFWKELKTHYSSENNAEVIVQDDVSCVKSIFQLVGHGPFEVLKPIVEELLEKQEKNKQRGAAEFLAGVLAGSKHWPTNKQLELWQWSLPLMKKIFSHTNNDTISIWSSFLEYMFYRKDPRRVQPLVDYLVEEFHSVNFQSESTLEIIKVLCYFRALYEQLGWKFSAWTDEVLRTYWPHIASEHDEVVAYISEMMTFSSKVMWRPNPSVPTTEAFVRESRTAPLDADLMGARGVFHEGRVLELARKFPQWREERLPGVRAFQSTYDRVGVLVCRWLFQMVHDTNAITAFDYILPLMPELFRFTEINDNDDLATRAGLLLNRMCGVIPPRRLIHSVLDQLFQAIQKSPSWRVRLKILPLVQIYYFRQGPLIKDVMISEMMEVICRCLDDEVVEVREMAATTLSAVLRVSPRRSVVALKVTPVSSQRRLCFAQHPRLF
ncbi:hypothetical protein NLI96_g1377 [Meripilus lineatus]|uniref:Proteasome activator complex subunit 4-like HEAT repeat-like domain-containing protein n=1 Tax=Meripilus lineatus TaxID=2056292 RepID=A0AAD5YMZ0_9APHY|nr:hypothetical protein NLI96_g1377 [Physisporinus lineatus]